MQTATLPSTVRPIFCLQNNRSSSRSFSGCRSAARAGIRASTSQTQSPKSDGSKGRSGTTAGIPMIAVTVIGHRFGRMSGKRVALGNGTAECEGWHPMNVECHIFHRRNGSESLVDSLVLPFLRSNPIRCVGFAD